MLHGVFVSWCTLVLTVINPDLRQDRVTEEKGPETELELEIYTLSRSFSHESH